MSNATIVSRRPVDRWFFIGVALWMILLNVIGFAPSIIEPSGRNVPLPFTPLVAAHVIVSAAFLLIFLAQAALVATGRTDVHRRLGIAGAVLALALVVLSYLALVGEARRGFDLSGDLSSLPPPPGITAAAFIMSPLVQLVMFGILFGAALHYRHRADVHKRLMLLAVLGFLSQTPMAHVVTHWPALHPWANVIFPVNSAVVLSLSAIHDWAVSGRIHTVSLWVPVVLFVLQTLFFLVIVPTDAWNSVATWLIQ